MDFFHAFDQEKSKEVTSKDRIMCVMGQRALIEHNKLHFLRDPVMQDPTVGCTCWQSVRLWTSPEMSEFPGMKC